MLPASLMPFSKKSLTECKLGERRWLVRLIPHRVGPYLKARAGEELLSVTLGQGSETFQPPYFTLAKCHVRSPKRSKGSWLLFHYFVLHVAASSPSFRLFLAKKGDAHGRVWHFGLETSRSRDFCPFFSSLGIGIGKFGLGYKVSVSVSENLVSEKKSRYRYRQIWSR